LIFSYSSAGVGNFVATFASAAADGAVAGEVLLLATRAGAVVGPVVGPVVGASLNPAQSTSMEATAASRANMFVKLLKALAGITPSPPIWIGNQPVAG
jgi:hypothetical protein